MISKTAFFLTLVAQPFLLQAAYGPDEITSLPGWSGPLPSKQYSGYLSVSTTKLHYWLVEAGLYIKICPFQGWCYFSLLSLVVLIHCACSVCTIYNLLREIAGV